MHLVSPAAPSHDVPVSPKREYERILAPDVRADVSVAGSSFVEGFVHDVSSGGLFLRAPISPASGTVAVVRLHHPDGRTFEVAGQVVHSVDPSSQDYHRSQGLGIHFDELSDDAQRELRSFLTELDAYPREEPARPTVIIVDDDRDTREMLQLVLELEGFRALHASSALRLLSALRVDAPDAILLDIRMSWMGGIETCRALKANPKYRDLPVVFISATSDPADIDRAAEVGADGFYSKPLDTDRLIGHLRSLVRRRSAHAEGAQ